MVGAGPIDFSRLRTTPEAFRRRFASEWSQASLEGCLLPCVAHLQTP
jgi:hypothetical protein